METIEPIHLASTISSLEALQKRCNFLEMGLTAKLTKIEAARNENGVKVTEVSFEAHDGSRDELGILKFEKHSDDREDAAVVKGDAFINTVRTDVLIFR
ncbi:MAG: hypothetical protein ABIP06_10870 [Pyrinomonadaceae bacterium]